MKREDKRVKKPKTGDMGIEIGLWTEIKVVCLKRGITLSQAAEEAFEPWVKRHMAELLAAEAKAKASRKPHLA